MHADASLDAPPPAVAGRERGATALLRIEGLTVRFGGLTALDNVNLEMPRGEIRAIIGPNGAGKSTFFNCLTGVLRPTSGRILFDGEDITGLSPDRISRKGIARSYQITNILPNATTFENVRIACQSRGHSWSMLRHYRGFETGDTMALVRRIAKNLTILIVEHDMQVVMGLAQRITVFHYGRVLADGAPAEIRENPRV